MRPTRLTATAAAIAVQAALLVVAVAPRLSARLTGEEYLVRVAPIDPIDPFRGAYVRLAYPDLALFDQGRAQVPGEPAPSRAAPPPDGTVYVALVRDGSVWRADGPPTPDEPADGPFIRCEYDGTLRCGIESYFLPQDEARSLERDLATDGGVARLLIDGRGHAVVTSIDAGT